MRLRLRQKATRPEATTSRSAELLREHDVDKLGSGDEERQAADRDADEGSLPPPAPRVGEHGEAAEGEAEQRRRGAADYSERECNRTESPDAHDDRKNRAKPDGCAVTRLHGNKLPKGRSPNRRLG